MPTPTIPAGNLFMNATIWTGDNTTPRSITNGVTGQSFQPDFVWIKSRSAAYQHNLYDSVRGAGAAFSLSSDQTAAEGGNSNVYGFLSAFNSNGFAVTQGTAGGGGAPNGNAYTNQTSTTYVAWNWKAGGAAVTNTAGSISAQVSANTTSGFSVVTYTGNATSGATVGHGLGVAPSFIIAKNRINGGTDWPTFHVSTGNNGGCTLNESAAKVTTAIWWNNTTPSSTVVTLGSGAQTNGSGNGIVLYCWSQIAGYSAFGSYTGNGSADGPFVYTGFRPRFIVIKSTGVEDWRMFDTSRSTYNIQGATLYPNTSSAENAAQLIDINSNGFKCRTTDGAVNGSGTSYIYMAFAENPFKYALAR